MASRSQNRSILSKSKEIVSITSYIVSAWSWHFVPSASVFYDVQSNDTIPVPQTVGFGFFYDGTFTNSPIFFRRSNVTKL